MAGNEVRIRVTAKDDTGRVFAAVERKFRDFGKRINNTATKVSAKADVDQASFKAVEAKAKALSGGGVKIPVKPELSAAAMKEAEAKAKALSAGGIKIPVKPDIDRTFWSRVQAFRTRSHGAFQGVGLNSGAAFMAGFIKVISFGQVGSGFARSAIKLAPKMAKVGAVLGAGLAAALVLQLTNVLTAALPLAIGAAMLALPIVGLIKPMIDAQKEIEKITGKITTKQVSLIEAQERVREASNKKQRKAAEERVRDIKEEIGLLEKSRAETEKIAEPLVELTDRWKHFLAEISKPVKPYLLGAMDLIGFRLDHWAPAVKKAFKELGPVLIPFTQGVLDGIEAFFSAIGREMPGIKAGMGAWADAFPKIGDALGGLIADVIKDPEGTIQAVTDFVGTLQDLADTSAAIIGTVQDVANAYGDLATQIDKLENNSNGQAGFEGIGQGVVDGLDKLSRKIDDKIIEIREKFKGWLLNGGLADAIKSFGNWLGGLVEGPLNDATDAVKNWAKDLPGKIKDGFKKGMGDIANSMVWTKILDGFRKFKDKAVKWVKDTWHDLRDSFVKNHTELINSTKRWVDKVVDKIKALPGKAKNALNSLAGKVGKEFEDAKDKAVSKAKDLVNKTVDWFQKLPGRAKAAVNSLSSKLGGEVEQAKDSVVRKARAMVTGFIDRMQELVRRARDYAGRVKGAITDRFKGARDWLVTAGRNIIRGFNDGLHLAFNAVKKWVGGIAKWIKDHKGPVSVDRQLLVPAGKALMSGLLEGLKFGFKGVGDFVYSRANSVKDVIGKIKDSMMGPAVWAGGKVPGGIAAFKALIARKFHVGAGTYPGHGAHGANRAWDFMIHSKAQGNAIAAMGRTVASLVIWNRRIWSRARAREGWRPYTRYGNTSDPGKAHTNHVHVEWYRHGGWINEPIMGVGRSGRLYGFGEAGRELVTPAAKVGVGGNTYITINAPNYVGSQEDLRRTLVDMNRRGQLEVIKRR